MSNVQKSRINPVRSSLRLYPVHSLLRGQSSSLHHQVFLPLLVNFRGFLMCFLQNSLNIRYTFFCIYGQWNHFTPCCFFQVLLFKANWTEYSCHVTSVLLSLFFYRTFTYTVRTNRVLVTIYPKPQVGLKQSRNERKQLPSGMLKYR